MTAIIIIFFLGELITHIFGSIFLMMYLSNFFWKGPLSTEGIYILHLKKRIELKSAHNEKTECSKYRQ